MPTIRGFTLVEMMVAVSIFVIVAFIVTSAFLVLADANRKAQNIRLVMDNLNFAIDAMALKMREGSNFSCVITGNSSSCDNISFTSFDGIRYTYCFAHDPEIDRGRIWSTANGGGACGTGSTPLTAPQIDVDSFRVLLNVGLANPLRAAVLIRGTAGSGRTLTSFNIQTTVSERNFSNNP